MDGLLRVLIVEDQYSVRSMIRSMLTQTGYFASIEEASDGEEAWEKLGMQSFDLVLSDINMPKLDGLTLMKRCRSRDDLKDVPFLMVTGERARDWVASAGEWGAYDYIIKPFSYDLFKSHLDGILSRMKSPEEAFYRKIGNMKELGETAAALESLDRWLASAREPKARLLNLKGELLMGLGRFEAAAQFFEATMENFPLFLMAYKNYAVLQQKLGNAEKAIEALEKADELSPMDDERKLSLGRLLIESDRKERGRDLLMALSEQAREDTAVCREIARIFLANGMYSAAESVITGTLKGDTGNVEMFNQLGIALRKQGKYAEAVNNYNLAVRYHPSNPTVHYNLGILHFAQNDPNTARKCFERALELDPGFKEAKAKLDMLRDLKPVKQSA